jgi:hypothetical protein
VSTTVVPLPVATQHVTPGDLLTDIDLWIRSAPLRDLVTLFGGRWPATGTDTLLSWLDGFSAMHWDFRRGRERPDAAEPVLDAATAHAVTEAARALGLVDATPPPLRDYRHIIVLGGLATACLLRTGYTAHLLHTRRLSAEEVSALGSFRDLSDAERDLLARNRVDGCRAEVDVLDTAVRRWFALPDEVEESGQLDRKNPHRSWSVRTYRPVDGPLVRVLAAPSSDPTVRRAHTADTQHFWARHVRLSPDDPVLVVTTPIYVPFQHCDAVRTLTLRYGCAVDTVGVDPAYTGGLPPQPPPTPGRYLQEIRSAIRSMHALYAALTSAGT